MKKVNLYYFLIFSALLLISFSGCYIETVSKEIEAKPEDIKAAVKEVGKELKAEVTEGPLNAKIWARGGFLSKTSTVNNAAFFISKEKDDILNNTGYMAAIKISDYSISNNIMEVTAGTRKGDPKAYANLLIELTKQQLDFQAGLQKRAVNKPKSKGLFILLNTLSPIAGTEYLLKDNPLITPGMKQVTRLNADLGDVFMLALGGGSLFVKNSSTRQRMLGGGITLGILFRVFTLLNIKDLDDYNDLANTKYDLQKISLY